MIKFFRNIRQNLIMENKTVSSVEASAKAGKYLKYAIGEIVLVVIGILMALQINSYNQSLVDKKNEMGYLKGTHLVSNLASTTHRIAICLTNPVVL